MSSVEKRIITDEERRRALEYAETVRGNKKGTVDLEQLYCEAEEQSLLYEKNFGVPLETYTSSSKIVLKRHNGRWLVDHFFGDIGETIGPSIWIPKEDPKRS